MTYEQTIAYHLKNDKTYLDAVRSYHCMSNLQEMEIQTLCECAKQNILESVHNKFKQTRNISQNNSTSLTHSSVDSSRTKTFTDNNNYNKSHQSINDKMNNEASNQFIAHDNSSTSLPVQKEEKSFYNLSDRDKQMLVQKKLTRTNKKQSNNKKIIKNKICLTPKEKDQFVCMVYDNNNDFYESIVRSMKLANKMISTDAIDDNKNNNNNNDTDDDDDISYNYDDKFDDDDESEDNENNNQHHNNINNENDNNDDANIEDTEESIVINKKQAHLTSNKKRILHPSLPSRPESKDDH
jgi:hypothetical protein